MRFSSASIDAVVIVWIACVVVRSRIAQSSRSRPRSRVSSIGPGLSQVEQTDGTRTSGPGSPGKLTTIGAPTRPRWRTTTESESASDSALIWRRFAFKRA